MLRLLLADDEPVIMRGMQHLVDWESLGIQITDLCADGTKAMESVLSNAPDIAILDISMPGMDGIQILKNISDLGLPTKVIFVSGFQNFSYAQNALRYGAVEYLLKPVKREDLLAAVSKAVGMPLAKGQGGLSGAKKGAQKEQEKAIAAKKEEAAQNPGTGQEEPEKTAFYLPVLAELLLPRGTSRAEEKLLRFAFESSLRKEMEEGKRGPVFSQGGDTLLVLKNLTADAAEEVLSKIADAAGGSGKGTPVFLLGAPIPDLLNLPEVLGLLQQKKGLLYFADRSAGTVILQADAGEEPDSLERLSRIRRKMFDDIVSLKEEAFEKDYDQFSRALQHAAVGKREDACYYYCSSVRTVQDHLLDLKMQAKPLEMKELLETAQSCADFGELRARFYSIFADYLDTVRESARGKDTREITQMKNYIDTHYREELTLGVMAQQFYMNPYYFSSYFKKQTGTNFKDYVSYVRIQHALSLLITTGMTTYEIAAEVGFPDARAFSDAFLRRYGESPTAYRKRAGSDKGRALGDGKAAKDQEEGKDGRG